MKFDVAANLQYDFLDYLGERDKNHEIVSLYGKMQNDVIGGGRPSSMISNVDIDYIEKYNKKCKEIGVTFNYLMNPLCMGGKDVDPKEHKKIIAFIHQLHEIGISAVTVNSPYLCEIIKKQIPDMQVTIGVYSIISSLTKVKSWVDLGADEITLGHEANRNFPLIKNMLTILKDTGVSIRLIANNGCLHQCPFEINHGSTVSHACNNSNIQDRYIDYSLINCYYRKIKYPNNLIASDWIRPEDVHWYEELCDEVGNDNLVLKLVERTKTTKYMKNVVDAYLNRSYDGNLSDLMNWNQELLAPINPKGFMKAIATGEINFSVINRYFKFFNVPIPNIKNKELDGFFEHFVKHYDCENKTCWNGVDEKNECTCSYCYEWAKKVVSQEDEHKRNKWLENNEKLMKGMVTSAIFNNKN